MSLARSGWHSTALPALARLTSVRGWGWPTARAQDAKHGAATAWELTTPHAGTKDSLRVHVVKRARLGEDITAPLNPEWVEWLMGFPAGWTQI